MRLDLKLETKGDDRRKEPIRRPITQQDYFNWVDALPLSDAIKDKFKALVLNMPSSALRTVMERRHKYVLRFEQEINQELIGHENQDVQPELNFAWAEAIYDNLEEQNGTEEGSGEEEVAGKKRDEEVLHESGESEDQG